MANKTLKRTTRSGNPAVNLAAVIERLPTEDKPVIIKEDVHYHSPMPVVKVNMNREPLRQYGLKVSCSNRFPWSRDAKRAAKRDGTALPKWDRRTDQMRVWIDGVRADATDEAIARLTDLIGAEAVAALPRVDPQARGVRAAQLANA